MTCELCKDDYGSLYPVLVCILSQHTEYFFDQKKDSKMAPLHKQT